MKNKYILWIIVASLYGGIISIVIYQDYLLSWIILGGIVLGMLIGYNHAAYLIKKVK